MWNGDAIVVPEGPSHQADIPPMAKAPCTEDDRDECVWRMSNGIDENALKSFYDASKAKLDAADTVLPDDALYMLMKSDFDFMEAAKKVKNSTNQSDEAWTDEDQLALSLAFGVVEKDFTALARMFPGKSFADIAERYYNTKKTVDYRGLRHRSLQDEPFTLLAHPELQLDIKSIPSKDSEAKPAGSAGKTCQNCGLHDVTVYKVNKTRQCLPCKNFFMVTNKRRPCRQDPVQDAMEEVAAEFSAITLTTGAKLDENKGVRGRVARSKARPRAPRKDVKKAKPTLKRSEDDTKENDQGSKDESEIASKVPDLLADVKKAAKCPTIKYFWTKKEKETVDLCLSNGAHSPAALAKILGTKTETMVVNYLNKEIYAGEVVCDKMTDTETKNVSEASKEADSVEKQEAVQPKKPRTQKA